MNYLQNSGRFTRRVRETSFREAGGYLGKAGRFTDFQQVQLAALQSSEMKFRIEHLDKAIKGEKQRLPSPRSNFERKLSTWERQSACAKKHRPTYQALWKLHMTLGPSLNGRMLSELLAVALGAPRKDPKTVKSQLDTLLKKTGG